MEGLLFLIAIVVLNVVASKIKEKAKKKPEQDPATRRTVRRVDTGLPPPPSATENRRFPSHPAPTQPIPDPLGDFLKTIGVEPEDVPRTPLPEPPSRSLDDGNLGGEEGGRKALEQASRHPAKVHEDAAGHVPKKAMEASTRRKITAEGIQRGKHPAPPPSYAVPGMESQMSMASMPPPPVPVAGSALGQDISAASATSAPQEVRDSVRPLSRIDPQTLREGMIWHVALSRPRWREPYRALR